MTGRDGRIPENVSTVSELNSYICDKLESDPKVGTKIMSQNLSFVWFEYHEEENH